jgi:sugar phosphate isomerase/epimerase
MSEFNDSNRSRRTFLRDVAMYGGAVMAANHLRGSLVSAAAGQTGVAASPDWRTQVGLELFTVRDEMGDPKSFEDTLQKIAAIGYKEIEPAGGYNGMAPREFRAMLDRYGLSMPSTHSGASGATQAELETALEGFAIMGIKYTGASIGGGRGGGRAGAAAPAANAATPAPARGGGGAQPAGAGGRGDGGGAPAAPAPPATVDSVRQRVDTLNKTGKIVAKFGMKILIHNHTQEFELLADGKTCTYDVYLAETDPSVIAMQMDVGWASVAGQDPIAWFKKYPGRFELWHVKDAINIKNRTAGLPQGARPPGMMLVPIGLGEVDYKTIFQSAKLAGLKHFKVEQDNAAAWGDSIAAARVSYTNLTTKVLV